MIIELQFNENLCKDTLFKYNRLGLYNNQNLRCILDTIPKEFFCKLHHVFKWKIK